MTSSTCPTKTAFFAREKIGIVLPKCLARIAQPFFAFTATRSSTTKLATTGNGPKKRICVCGPLSSNVESTALCRGPRSLIICTIGPKISAINVMFIQSVMKSSKAYLKKWKIISSWWEQSCLAMTGPEFRISFQLALRCRFIRDSTLFSKPTLTIGLMKRITSCSKLCVSKGPKNG